MTVTAPANTPRHTPLHTSARTAERANNALLFVRDLVFAALLIALLVHLALGYMEPCAEATLCAGVLPFMPAASLTPLARCRRRQRADDATPPPPDPPTVQQYNAERLHEAVIDAYTSGLHAGEQAGYVRGARWGAVAGCCWGLLLGAIATLGAFSAGYLSVARVWP